MTGYVGALRASGEGERSGRSGSAIASLTLIFVLAVAVLSGLAADRAAAAAPVILNTSSTNGQTNWLESFNVADDTGNQTQRVWVTLTVKHDPGRRVTGIRIDDDYNGSDNTSGATLRAVTAQQPTVVNGFDHSRISYNYLASTSGTDLSCPFVGSGTVSSTKPIRIRAQLDNGEQTATSSSNIRWTRTDCNARDDHPRIFNRSQSATSVNTGTSVTFTLTGDDSDALGTTNQTFGGINWRARRLSDGVTTAVSKICWGGSDNTARSFSANFNRRGRWVVEAELLNENNSCGTNPNSGGWFYIGAVDVNAPAASSPTATLDATRPQIGGNTTVTATFADGSDAGEGGRVQAVEWDLDQNTGNGVSGFEIAQLGDWKTGIASPQSRTINTAGMTPGSKTVRARITDNGAMSGADNIRRTRIVTTTFLVDTPPIALPASLRTVSGTDLPLALAGTDVDGDDLGYSITDGPDHGTLTGSGASRVYSPAPGFAGTDSFTFEVNDGYGGTSAADVTVRVDPDITGFDGPAGALDSRAGEIEFGSSVAGATFECSIDEGDWQACSSPWTLTDLDDGEHTMRTRVTANGLTNPDAAEATWTVDAFPKIEVTDGPDAESSSTGVAIDFTLSEAGATAAPTAECRLDGHEWTPCLSPVEFSDLDDGDHTVRIRATDAFGKQAVETVEWTIVTAGSATAINAPAPATFTRDRTATINFAATGEVQSFECSLDGGAWEPCASPAQLTGLGDGSHTFRVRSIDALGNPEALPAQISWTVDRTPPEVTVTSGPDGPVPAGPAAFGFTSNESLSAFECRLDDGEYASCSSPFHLPADLADGPHTFRVAAIDRAGNRSQAVRRDFRILSVAPQVNLTGGPAQGEVTRSNASTFGFGAAVPVAGFECRIDGADWARCEPPAAMTGLLDGPHSFAVRAIDEVGNRSAEPTVREWTVDTIPPETSITEGPAAQSDSAEAGFAFASSEAGSSFECSLDEAPFTSCASPVAYESLADGAHRFRVRATDPAGNRDGTPAVRDWTIDTTVPEPPAPLPATEPDPCTFLIEQDRCGDPYVVASARAPFRKRTGKGWIKVDVDSGGSALGQVIARLPAGLRTKSLSGRAGRAIGRVVLTGERRTVVNLRLPRVARHADAVAGARGGPRVVLRPRSLVIGRMPAGTTEAKIRLKSTRGLRVISSICGTRLWRTVLTDAASNREDVNARADVACVRKGNR